MPPKIRMSIATQKFGLLNLLAVVLAVQTASAEHDTFFAEAFAAVAGNDAADQEWTSFLSSGPPAAVNVAQLTDDPQREPRELHHGFISNIKCSLGGLEVDRPDQEICLKAGEGICRDGWKFGIGKDKGDSYLQLLHPASKVYQMFKGSEQLCIGQKGEDVAYLYVVFGSGKGTYYLVARDAGRDQLKIREQDKYINPRTPLYMRGNKDETIVHFSYGSGNEGSIWQIRSNGFSKTNPEARWFFVASD